MDDLVNNSEQWSWLEVNPLLTCSKLGVKNSLKGTVYILKH